MNISCIDDVTPCPNDFYKMDEDGMAPTISQYSSSAKLDVIQQIKFEMIEEVQPDVVQSDVVTSDEPPTV